MAQTTNELRETFLGYFEKHSHKRERSSPLVPQNDPTLLFTNAGMVQFKDLFTGVEKRAYSRATTCQKCVRAGGKHNDLENVGFTKRHHTFFEMLGNFSFGDYFKKEAIEFAWEFVNKVVQFPSERIWISIFEKDDEAEKLWLKISGLPKERIVRMGEKDNFWAMGETGPCGPCSEIYFDRGENFGTPGETIFDGGERYLEFWNLVFMQYEKFEDGTMKPLPRPSVDTGMGLERLASLIQNVDSTYQTDGLNNILQSFAAQLKKTPGESRENDVALRVLTDHIRAVSFLIADGVQPSNEGRGYVLRRILRRAIRYGKKLDCRAPFFHQGVAYVEREMGKAYPELTQNKSAIQKMIFHEEEKFFETLDTGLKLLDQKTSQMGSSKILPGSVAFQLYDTYGFPVDLTEVILKERGLSLDHGGFEAELEGQRARSRTSWKGSGEQAVSNLYKDLASEGVSSTFTGYHSLEEKTRVKALLLHSKAVDEVRAPAEIEIVLEKTPFYAESGGQVGDQGYLQNETTRVIVEDCFKPVPAFFVLKSRLEKGRLKRGDELNAVVDRQKRLQIRINHTMTHVLHAILHDVLGEHIKQAGSLVHSDYLRFDFTHFSAVSKEELRRIEMLANLRIRENAKVGTDEQDLEKAIAGGAKAFFDEKYGDRVRVVSVGEFSKELCGGTHAESLGEAGLFKIVSESSVGSGIRRIVAYTGAKAYDYIRAQEELLESLSELLKAPEKELTSRVQKLLQERAELQKKLSSASLASKKEPPNLIQEIEGMKAIVSVESVEDIKDLRPLVDQYKQKLKSGIVVVGTAKDDKATVVVSLTDDLASLFQMPKLVDKLSAKLGGRGGGKPNFVQIGGPNISELSVENLTALLREHLHSLKLVA